MLSALLLAAILQDAKPSACDLVRVEDGKYCAACDKVLAKTEKTTDFDKDGNCRKCSAAPATVKVCVKEWVESCGMHDQRAHERGCCASKFCCRLTPVYARVVEGKCSLSGKAPHGAFCDLKTVETGLYCPESSCRKLLEKADLDKDGRCLTCKRKPQAAKVCVKKDEDRAFRARVALSCRACKAEGAEGASCGTKGCVRAGQPLEPICTDSGAWPHGGEPPKREK